MNSRTARVALTLLLVFGFMTSFDLVKPVQAKAAGISCLGKDRVAGVCLPKTRKKWSLSVENNYLLSCVSSATNSGTGALSEARAYCGCTLVAFEKSFSQKAFAAAEQKYLVDGVVPQKWRNIMAGCL